MTPAPAAEPPAPAPRPAAPGHLELLWEAAPSAAPPVPNPRASRVAPLEVPPAREPAKPVPTGLERLSDEWPTWARVAIQYRGRAEYGEPLAPASIGADGYYLNRIRLQGTFTAASWLRFAAQTQDSQILGYNIPAVSRFANTLDLRLAFAEVELRGAQPITVRGGRQELAFGDGRLVASPDWATPTARSTPCAFPRRHRSGNSICSPRRRSSSI